MRVISRYSDDFCAVVWDLFRHVFHLVTSCRPLIICIFPLVQVTHPKTLSLPHPSADAMSLLALAGVSRTIQHVLVVHCKQDQA